MPFLLDLKFYEIVYFLFLSLIFGSFYSLLVSFYSIFCVIRWFHFRFDFWGGKIQLCGCFSHGIFKLADDSKSCAKKGKRFPLYRPLALPLARLDRPNPSAGWFGNAVCVDVLRSRFFRCGASYPLPPPSHPNPDGGGFVCRFKPFYHPQS